MSTILAAAITTYFTIAFVWYGFLNGRLSSNLRMISQIRPKVVLSNLVVMTIVVITAINLNKLPVLNWSWWSLMGSDSSQSDGGGSNIIWAGLNYEYFAIIFILLLAVAMPELARVEEEAFREGTYDWLNAIPRSFIFGLVHCIVGVSIGVGLALTISGFWYTHHYFKGGVERSTLYHATWNLMIVGMIFGLLVGGQI